MLCVCVCVSVGGLLIFHVMLPTAKNEDDEESVCDIEKLVFVYWRVRVHGAASQ